MILAMMTMAGIAKEHVGSVPAEMPEAPSNPRAAGCSPATARATLEFNNVRALLETGGVLWMDRANGAPSYEVPKNSGVSAIFAGALWLGGVDANQQLKVAAVRFRQVGNDYWTGPLNTVSADIPADVCDEYDRFWTISRSEVMAHITFIETGQPPDYVPPPSILEWPAHGDVSLGQDFYLAPFYDSDGDGIYNPQGGDYPWYDLNKEVDCRTDREVTLFGDYTIWWIQNDNGNIHTETGADPIGMEIRSQAFAFSTNDEVNNMTFYNYELVNRASTTIYDTYFGQWVDADLGCFQDDYVGCDVTRGLGYAYNGDADDEDCGAPGYGANPPAIGVDFFEGPYQDIDGVDNPLTTDISQALALDGIPYAGIGIGYGDSIIDNERFGMRKFLYHNNDNTVTGDPRIASDYYNFMRGIWGDGTQMTFGDDGHGPGIPADYMFPGDSDPYNWGTHGVDPGFLWTEQTAGNLPEDRRFLQAAGPFTLEPGAVNNITVGIVYARAYSGDPFESVKALRVADDKAQALFDNCFQLLQGPDAPDIAIQELDRELILTLTPTGNNANEDYEELNPFVPEMIITGTDTLVPDRNYRFQGYQIFQLKDNTVGQDELMNVDRARLVFQCDIKDSIGQLINFEFDQQLNASVPMEMVDGADEGIFHSVQVMEDLFAQGDKRLVNHKTYYYMAIAYAHNNYKTYDQNDPQALDGQKHPYYASRYNVQTYVAIPHIPSPELMGTDQIANYGDGPKITRIEGQGNGGRVLDFTYETEMEIVANGSMDYPVYQAGRGPINVKVIDPLNVTADDFRLEFTPGPSNLDDATWTLYNLTTGEVINSDKSIDFGDEQLFPEYGISIQIEQYDYEAFSPTFNVTTLLQATIDYADSSKMWLSGVNDIEGFFSQNWIRSGTQRASDPTTDPMSIYDDRIWDDAQEFESMINGSFAPFLLAATRKASPLNAMFDEHQPAQGDLWFDHAPLPKEAYGAQGFIELSQYEDVDIVFTSDRSLWTRCVVIEMQDDMRLSEGGAKKGYPRNAPSVDQYGNPDGTGTGMGWFPGYAISLETGERLNMAFGEDSWLPNENGSDMMWNPSSTMYEGVGEVRFGGKHTIYVFKNLEDIYGPTNGMPSYDQGVFLYDKLSSTSPGIRNWAWRSCMWVGYPMLADGEELLSTDVKIRLRVGKAYEQYETDLSNNSDPVYEFSLSSLATSTQVNPTAVDALALINAVPNPYYGYSNYEANRLDNIIKIVNLPDACTIRIYNVSGTLVRTITKASPVTHVDWDLKNQDGIPIAGGLYIIHVEAPGIGEAIVKWFGALRPPDLDNF